MTTYTRLEVEVFSPGTFVSETRCLPIDAWDTRVAASVIRDVIERYGAKPYGFKLRELLCHDPIDDGRGGKLEVESREIRHSGMCFINGIVETLEQVEARNDPSEDILRNNMRCGGWSVVTTRNSYKHCAKFEPGDCIVDSDGSITIGQLTETRCAP